MKADPLKLLDAVSRQVTPREQAALSKLFDREIAALLFKRRRTLGLSRRAYAARTGRKLEHIVRVEKLGCRPSIEDLYAGAKILGPKTKATAWKLAVELQREAARRVLEPASVAAAA